MKKSFVFLACILLLMSTAACQNTPQNEKSPPKKDLTSFVKSVELPKNLSITFDPAKVKTLDYAKIYTIDHLELDPDVVSKTLLRREIVDSKPVAQGPSFQTGDESLAEYLYVFDGGKSFGTENTINGGMNYSIHKKEPKQWLISNIAGPVGLNDLIEPAYLRSNYGSFVDLSFKSYKDALTDVKKLLHTLGFPKIEVSESYSVDVKTLQEHNEKLLEVQGTVNENKAFSWSVDDEGYLFHFRQLIDEIPVINLLWQWGKGTETSASGNFMSPVTINVAYTKDGVSKIYASDIFDAASAISGEKQPLIDAAAALQVVLDEYKDLILEEGTSVTSSELLYVMIPKDDVYELIPAWVFAIAKPKVTQDPISKKELAYNDYSQYVVNAITGEKMSGSR